MPARTQRASALVLVAAAASCALAMPTARADETPGPGDIPVVETVAQGPWFTDQNADGRLTLHAVRRLPQATIVYFSIGFAPDAKQYKDRFTTMYLSMGRLYTTDTVTEEVSDDGAVIDRAGGKVYTPLVLDQGDNSCAVCSDNDQLFFGQEIENDTAVVGYLGVPPLPADVTTVDVMIGRRLFVDVPVSDGALEPAVPYQREVYLAPQKLGQGWPQVNLADINRVKDPARYSIRALSQTISQGAVAERSKPKQKNYDISASVLFDKDKAVVKPAGTAALRQLAGQLTGLTSGTLLVTGYTDNLGSESHGMELSKQRADAVAAALKPLLGAGVSLQTAGKGEADPIASNDTETGRVKNRRVTITVQEA